MQYDEGYFGKPEDRGYIERNIALKHVAASLVESFRPKTCLDIGCAWGQLVYHLREMGVDAYGVDVSSYVLSQARAEVRSYLLQADLEAAPLPFPPQSMDLVTALEVFEHLREPGNAIAEVKRVLGPGGVLFMTSPHPLADSKLGQFLLGRGWRRLDSTHVNVHGRRFWRRLFQEHGFRHRGAFSQAYRDQQGQYWLSKLFGRLPGGPSLWAYLAGACLFELDEQFLAYT